MITLNELIKGNDLKDIPQEHQTNLAELLIKINKVRAKRGKPMTVSSGYRSMAHHLEIYKNKGITDLSKIPLKSHHLDGTAVDIFDPKQELQKWCKDNEKFLLEVGFWLESFDVTTNWVHFQSKPYGSYKPGKSIWFNP